MNSLRISVVIPCYNAAAWIPETISLASQSLKRAGITETEFIVVDDGSTDDSAAVAETINTDYPVRVIRQENKGRFLARKAGVLAARYDTIFFIDTRIHLGPDATKFLVDQLVAHPERKIWNGHVITAREGNIIARFGYAVVFVGWRRYMANPRTTSFGLEDFDYYPKGTGCFFVPKQMLIDAIDEFETTTSDLKYSSDDTLLIRLLASKTRINLSPEFDCTYFARSTIRGFIAHTYNRGQYFVDGFLRPGTRFYYPLIVFLIGSFLGVLLIVIKPLALLWISIALVLTWLLELLVALILRVPFKDAASLFILSPLFATIYGLGIWRAVIRKCSGLMR
jgi:glycosyltransferase involved in cell wall biosynthesis